MNDKEKELLNKALELIGSMVYSLPRKQLVWDMWEADANEWIEKAIKIIQEPKERPKK